jgi:hypothetical protein
MFFQFASAVPDYLEVGFQISIGPRSLASAPLRAPAGACQTHEGFTSHNMNNEDPRQGKTRLSLASAFRPILAQSVVVTPICADDVRGADDRTYPITNSR